MFERLLALLAGLLLTAWWWLLSLPGLRLLDQLLYGVRGTPAPLPAADGFEHGFINGHGGIRLHFAASGPTEGRLVLLLHGFPETWYSWRHQLHALAAAGFRAVALDMRGYGASDRPSRRRDYALPLLVADVAAAVRALGRDKCTLFGHDWGGAVAWAVANSHPQLVERLAVFNIPHPAIMSTALRSNAAQIRRSWYIFFFQLPWLPERMLQREITRVFHMRSERLKDRDAAVFALNVRWPGTATAMINYYRNLFSVASLRTRWSRLDMPVLQVWGELDTALGVELTNGTVRWAPHLTQKFVPDCSHWCTQDRPTVVNAHIAEWLSATNSAAGAPATAAAGDASK